MPTTAYMHDSLATEGACMFGATQTPIIIHISVVSVVNSSDRFVLYNSFTYSSYYCVTNQLLYKVPPGKTPSISS